MSKKILHLHKLMGISHVIAHSIGLEYISSCILTPKSVWLKLPLKRETPLPPYRQLQNNLYLNSMKTSQEMKKVKGKCKHCKKQNGITWMRICQMHQTHVVKMSMNSKNI